MNIVRKTYRIVLRILLGLIILMFHSWSILALYFCVSPNWNLTKVLAIGGYALVAVLNLIIFSRKTEYCLANFIIFLLVVIWFSSIQPKVEAVYPENLNLPSVELNGDVVTIDGIRNFSYHTRDDYDVNYEKRTYDLSKLKTVDIFVNYWGIKRVAHTFISFGFSEGRYLPVSIETRPEVGETYGMLKGFFKQYELIYIWSDEQDVVKLRTNYRLEDAYLYRLNFTPEEAKELILDMLAMTNKISKKQEFYNTATHSCTNTIGDHVLKAVPTRQFSFWKRRMLTGDVDQRMYKEGWLETYGKSFEQLRQDAQINERAKAAGKKKSFSKKIRTHFLK